MKKFLKSHNAKDKLKVFIVSFLAITFLAVPVLAQEMSPEEKLAAAKTLSTQAFEKERAARAARAAGDLGLAVQLSEEALAFANQALALIADVAGNAELAQAAMDITTNLDAAITRIEQACNDIAQTSTDPGIVDAANEILAEIEAIQNLIKKTTKILIASGAVPGPAEAYEPPPTGLEIPVDEEPPIQDITPASGT